jgi:hypothetical protein
MSAIMGAVSKKDYGIASGAVATMRLLGQMVSMADGHRGARPCSIGHRAITPDTYARFLTAVPGWCLQCQWACCVRSGICFSMFRGRLRKP